MQLLQTLSIALLSLLLFACGGSLDGSTDDADETVVEESDSETEEETVVEEAAPAESGVPSYFTYSGASQSWVAIQGTGGVGRTEASVLTFQLLDLNGDAVSGVDVDFALTGPVGTTIDPLTGTTDDSGFVSTTVSSGKVSGSLRVTVTTSDGTIELVSDILSVSTGLPDQNSTSLSLANLAPEAWLYDGVEVTATVRLADHFNNAVPDGTAVYFTTEGGAIRDADTGTVGSCLTAGSACSLTWESQSPRPDGNTLDVEGLTDGCASSTIDTFAPCISQVGMGQPYGGRVTITAFAVGEESFIDNDADGWFTDGDDLLTDLPEVFYDHNEDDQYKAVNDVEDQQEEFHDFAPVDQAYSSADGQFNGQLCAEDSVNSGLCTRDLINVRADIVLIMASGNQYFRVQNSDGDDINSVDLTTAAGSASAGLQVYVADIFNNRPPTGTTIAVTTDNGELSGQTSWVVADSNGYGPYAFPILLTREAEANEKAVGAATITVTSPGTDNYASTVSTYQITVTDDG